MLLKIHLQYFLSFLCFLLNSLYYWNLHKPHVVPILLKQYQHLILSNQLHKSNYTKPNLTNILPIWILKPIKAQINSTIPNPLLVKLKPRDSSFKMVALTSKLGNYSSEISNLVPRKNGARFAISKMAELPTAGR